MFRFGVINGLVHAILIELILYKIMIFDVRFRTLEIKNCFSERRKGYD